MVAFFYPDDDAKTTVQSPAAGNSHAGTTVAEPPQLTPPSGKQMLTKEDYSSYLDHAAWNREVKEAQYQPWNATVKGRGMIRLFSRGVLGAVAFAAGGRYAKMTMAHYNPEAELTAASSYSHFIAKGIDRFVGRPIQYVTEAMNMDGKALTTFRPTKRAYDAFGIGQNGVTLGHEVVQMTADFAAASMGDAVGRDIANAFDPNIKQNWVDDQGRVKYDQVLKNVGRNAFKYVTYNQGEDWAVAIPYVFFTRFQRNLFDKVRPGFGYDSDRRLNGGSFKVDKQGNTIGNYSFEGAMDLQSRFTAYNVGTLMFREAYAETGHELKHWYKHGSMTEELSKGLEKISHPLDLAGKALHWAARDTVKGIMYMTPAMPAFWMFRTPQSKYRGTFINAEEGMIAYRKGVLPHQVDAVHANEITRSNNKLTKAPDIKFSGDTPTFFGKYQEGEWRFGGDVANPLKPYVKPANPDKASYPSYETTYGRFDAFINPLGKINNKARKKGHDVLHAIETKTGIDLDTEKLRGKNFMDSVINASFAYTPYFFVKSDAAAYNIDNAKMDMAIEDTLSGLTSLNFKRVREGFGEMYQAVRNRPFVNPEREIEAQKRICADKSAADGQDTIDNEHCLNNALHEFTMHQRVAPKKVDTQPYAERIQDSKKRSKNMLDNFRKEEVSKFADMVNPRLEDESFAKRELWKKSQSRDDFPVVGTTLH